jgi:protein SCO1
MSSHFNLRSLYINVVMTCASLAMTMLVALLGAATLTSCRQPARDIGERGGFEIRDTSDCLPDITLVDQNSRNVSLVSLKGKPVLFDFIYTTCPGPCLLLTSRMKRIADRLGPKLGTEARIVSITVDPEHDRPEQLRTYANAQGADVNGWLFLTGTPAQIEEVMSRFKLIRQREADGTVDHVLEFFLVDSNGHALLQYMGEKAEPDRVASDVERAAAHEPVAAGDSANAGLTVQEANR